MLAIWNSAWTLLLFASLFWAGNSVVGRGVAGLVPPIALAFWRWTGAFFITLAFACPHLRRDWPTLLRAWPPMLALSATGIALFNTLQYIGLNSTTALNALLLNSVAPLLILLFAFVLFRERPSWRQSLGIVISLLGVAAIAARGSLDMLVHFRFNEGHVWIIVAMAIYAAYAVLLRLRPTVHPLSFLAAAMGVGVCMILPAYMWEIAEGRTISGVAGAYLGMAYTAVFPSVVSYLCFNRAVELIGAARAGQSVHLIPLFGSALAVLFLGERFHLYHAAGIALIAAGIALATVKAIPLRPALAGRRSTLAGE